MRIKDIKSLVWLYRWYNGRSQRLQETHQVHLAAVSQLVVDELGGTPQGSTEVCLCGFSLIVKASPDGLAIESITPPTFINGVQLMLFDADLDDDYLAGQYCESTEEVQREVAYR
ncbi:MAG: hypothetical protein WC553_03175 [Patescibacteria group bacterium]